MKRKIFSILFALVLALSFSLVTAVPVAADTIIVTPFSSIQEAIDVAGPGDIITVEAGTYDLTSPIVVDEDITIIGDIANPGNVIINAPTGGVDMDCFQVRASGVTIQGFLIQGALDAASGDGFQNAGVMIGTHWVGVPIKGLHDIDISYNVFVDCSKGIFMYHVSDSTVSYNTFTTTEGQTIDNFTDTTGWGGDAVHVYLWDPSDYPTGNTISYNTMDNVRVGVFLNGDHINGTDPSAWDFSGTTIENNTMTDVWNAGIMLQCASGTVESPITINLNDIETSTGRRTGDEGNERGLISVHGDYTVITGNTLTNSEGHGLWVDGSHHTVTGNMLASNTKDGIHVGWYKELEPNHGWTLSEITRADIGVANNTFEKNTVQVGDPTGVLDMQSVLDNNTFDRAVVVDREGASLLHTIWSKIQNGIDAALAGDTVIVAAGTYLQDDQINVVTSSLTIQGAGKGNTIVRRAGTPVYGQYWRVFDVSAESDVTISDMTVGYETLLPAGGPEETPVPGYVIAHGAGYSPTDNLIIDNVAFDGGRSAILCSGTELVVRDCSFTGEWQRPCIRPTGADFLITGNNFQELHYKYGPVQLGGGATSGEISYNQFSNGAIPGYFSSGGAVFTIEVYTSIGPGNLVIKGNTFDGITGHTDTLNYKGNPHKTCAIYVESSTGEGNILVEDNTFFGYDKYAMLFYGSSGIIVTNNTISGNLKGIVVWGECDIHINFNDIFGNSEYGVEAYDAPPFDAHYNWWGDVTGPEHATLNPNAQGNAVSDNVLFSPWLYKPKGNFVSDAPCYAGSVVLGNEATLVEPGSYAGGWNSFSTPVTLAGSANTWGDLLALVDGGGLSIVRAQRFDPSTQLWVLVVVNNSLYEGKDYSIEPGEGFFIQISTEGSLPVLCSTIPTSPPMTGLLPGWNLFGLSNLGSMSVADALSGISYSVVLSALPPNVAAWSVPPGTAGTTMMYLGEAYWGAVGQPGILFGFTATPVADDMTWELNQ